MKKLFLIISLAITLYIPATYTASEKSHFTHEKHSSFSPNQDTINQLPPELLQLILTQLQSDSVALIHASRTCKSWHATVTDITSSTIRQLLQKNNNDPEHAFIPAIHKNLALCVASLIGDYQVDPNTTYFMNFKHNKTHNPHLRWLNTSIVDNMTPLMHALIIKNTKRLSDLSTIQALLFYHADPNIVEQSGNTALHYAAHYNDTESVDILLKHHALTEKKNLAGKTAYNLSRSPHVQSKLNAYVPLSTRLNTWDMNIVSASVVTILAIIAHNYYIQN